MSVASRSVRRSAGKGQESTTSRSVRTPNDIWARAKGRATREGMVINRVIIELLEGYAQGVYRLPKRQVETVRVYDTHRVRCQSFLAAKNTAPAFESQTPLHPRNECLIHNVH